MKKISFLCIVFLGSLFVHAGFTIKGEIKNYENRNLLFSMYNDFGVQIYLAHSITDKAGKFKIKVKENYQGLIQMEMEEHGGLRLYSTGKEDIVFSSVYNTTSEDLGQVEFSEDSSNHILSNIDKTQNLKEIIQPQLSELMNNYKPEDHFYTEIQKEINRIDNLKTSVINGRAGLAKYHETDRWIANFANLLQQNAPTAGKELKNKLLDESLPLEKNGQLGNMIYSLISYYTFGAQTKEAFESRIKDSIKQMDQQVERTTRYQNMVGNYIQILKANGLVEVAEEVLAYYESMDFENKGMLKDLIDKKLQLEAGAKIPNFSFEYNRGKKQLYDVKSKYKLVLFWSSWCPACTNELPDIMENYPEFKAMGGEIISFSLDISPTEYVNISKDFPWISSCDYKKWYSPVVELFNVDGTPTLVLLDEKNNVISSASRWSDLEIVPKKQVSADTFQVN